jgi:hypothetical protein
LLKSQSKRELQGAGATLLEEWIQTAQSLVQHLGRRLLGGSKKHESLRIRKIGMIQNVECIRAKLKTEAFAQGESLGE